MFGALGSQLSISQRRDLAAQQSRQLGGGGVVFNPYANPFRSCGEPRDLTAREILQKKTDEWLEGITY